MDTYCNFLVQKVLVLNIHECRGKFEYVWKSFLGISWFLCKDVTLQLEVSFPMHCHRNDKFSWNLNNCQRSIKCHLSLKVAVPEGIP